MPFRHPGWLGEIKYEMALSGTLANGRKDPFYTNYYTISH